MRTRTKMKTKSKTKTKSKRAKTSKSTYKAKKYARYTGMQLASIARKWQKKIVSLAKKAPTWTSTKGSKIAKQRRVIQQEIKRVAKFLRAKTISKIDARLKTLKTEVAKRLKVAINSSKVTSSAIKRLNAKRRQISNCATAKELVKLCKGFKVSSYKHPARTKAKKTIKKSIKKTGSYTKQTAKLKKEISTLRQRNTYMQKQVAKFRKDAAQLQRHYGTLSPKAPNLKLVEKEVSNIVRFSNALNAAVSKQRKAG